MKYTIRKAHPDDIAQIQRIAKESWKETYEGIIPRNIQNSFINMAYSDEMLKKRFEKSNMFVSVYDDIASGFADFSPVNVRGEIEIAALYIDPVHQGTGSGTALLNKGISNLGVAKNVFVNVEKENQDGIAFYKARGFTVVSEFVEGFNGHILRTVRMVLTL